MGAYLAPALAQLRFEVNVAHPKRDKASDGWIGDKDHQSRKSDHNPDPIPNGVVRALDIDDDGMDKNELRRAVLKDKRTEYFIQDGHIWLRSTGFRKQKYTGPNPHTSHAHISIRRGKTYENDKSSWGYKKTSTPAPKPGGKSVAQLASEVLAGRWGNGDERKRRLTAAGYNYSAVQAEVNRRLAGGAPSAHKPTFNEVVQEVIRGEWGNGATRKQRLRAAGFNPELVQAEVNRRLR